MYTADVSVLYTVYCILYTVYNVYIVCGSIVKHTAYIMHCIVYIADLSGLYTVYIALHSVWSYCMVYWIWSVLYSEYRRSECIAY